MLSYLIDVYYHQLRDLTGVNYGWVLRRFIAFFLVGLLIGIVATNALSDIRSDFQTGSIEIWFDETGDRKKVYLYADAEVTRWVEGNEHFSELTWADGYCLKFSHYHKSDVKPMKQERRESEFPPTQLTADPPVPPTVTEEVVSSDPPPIVEQTSDKPSHSVETNIIFPEAPSDGRASAGFQHADGNGSVHRQRNEQNPRPSAKSEPPPVLAPILQSPIRVTEYMVRDWSHHQSNLPQWIELHNPNAEAVNLRNYTFQYATRRFARGRYTIWTLTLSDFSIAGGGVALLTTRTVPLWRFSGIAATQVYTLNIENVLKRGWVLTDADGTEIHRLGRDAFSALTDPVAPPHQNKARVSHAVLTSEVPPEAYYYGHRDDVGSPGFYQELAPAAPSAVRHKPIGMWAKLKKR